MRRQQQDGIHFGPGGVHIAYDFTRSKLARFGLFLSIAALGLILWRVQHCMFSAAYMEPLIQDQLPSLDQQQLDAFLEMNRLLITLGTAVLGGLGFFLTRTGKRCLPWRELWPLVASAILAGCSLYFGYVAYQCILWMLQNDFFDMNNPAVLWARHYHFYTLLGSVLFFVDFFVHETSQEDRRERSQHAAA